MWFPGVSTLVCALVMGTSVLAQSPLAGIADVATPARVRDGVAPVGPANTRRDGTSGLIDVLLDPEPGLADRPIINPAATDATAGALRRLNAAGRAAGLAGVLYDNRDSGHSRLSPERFPQVARTEFDETFVSQNLHHGVAGRVRFPMPVVGNSSTALTQGPLARSLGRLALGDQASAMRSYRLFAANHLYVYPEHKDYDPETGDRLLAHTPYFLLSQGSSRSDRPLVDAALAIIAALPPETKAAAEASGRLSATVQAVIRRTLLGVNSAEAYLSPAAHSPVIDRRRLRPLAAISYAASLAPGTLPPLVTLTVERDVTARPGVDYLARNLGEVIFTTPMAVARAWRSFDHDRRVTLKADATPAPPEGTETRFHWVLLQGDPDRVEIRPRDDTGRVVDIDLSWHDRFPVQAGQPMLTPRVDIAVIADAGGALSAPAIFSVLFPAHQARTYRHDLGGRPLLDSVQYNHPTDPRDYADPLIWPVAPWRDELLRDSEGQLQAIRRTASDGLVTVLRSTPDGWETKNGPSHHIVQAAGNGVLEMRMEP